MDEDLHSRISQLVSEEHELRERHRDGAGVDDDERARMRDLEVQLDQTWDLLRQREARRAAGQDPAGAHERPPGEVENYLG